MRRGENVKKETNMYIKRDDLRFLCELIPYGDMLVEYDEKDKIIELLDNLIIDNMIANDGNVDEKGKKIQKLFDRIVEANQ